MSALYRIQEFFDKNQVKYCTIIHSPAFTAQEIAASSFISGDEFAKTVMLNVDGDLVMTVLPASKKIDIQEIKKYFHNENVTLADESEFRNIFPECKTGAMPPIGNLYNIITYVDKDLSRNKLIAFNAGNHSEVVRMKYSCFEKLVKPELLELSID